MVWYGWAGQCKFSGINIVNRDISDFENTSEVTILTRKGVRYARYQSNYPNESFR